MDEIKENKPLAEERAKFGKGRAEKEDKLLQFMLDGHQLLTIEKPDPKSIRVIYDYCELDGYERVILDGEFGYPLSPGMENQKIYCNCLAALDSLVERYLVKKISEIGVKYNGSGDSSKDIMDVKQDVKLRKKLIELSPIHTSRYILFGDIVNNIKGVYDLNEYDVTIIKMKYELLDKGYDVASDIQKHEDEKQRFEQQKEFTQQQMELTKQAIKASELSAESAKASRNIAGRAFWAAIAIAAASASNFFLSAYKEFCGSDKYEPQQPIISKPIEKPAKNSTERK